MFFKNLEKGIFISRYKRFFMDIKLNGDIITAHTPNTGSMLSLLDIDNYIYLEKNNDPKRKLRYTTQILQFKNQKEKYCLINTHKPNHLVFEAIKKGKIEEIKDYIYIKREEKYGEENKSRIDVYIEDKNNKKTYVEVKNCTLSFDNKICKFPDAKTGRGLKHLKELTFEVEKGNRSIFFFLISRNDCNKFQIAKEIDLNFYNSCIDAKNKGVEFLAYQLDFKKTKKEKNMYDFEVFIKNKIKIDWS
jgi:sugar fermentation stimulation protein A